MSRLLSSRPHRTFLLAALLSVAFPAFTQSTDGTFTIAAGSVSITPTGGGFIPFTLTSVNGYAGPIVVGCQLPTVAPSVKIPTCGGGPVRVYNLTADQVLTGSVQLNAYGQAVPAGIVPLANPVVAILFVFALLSGLTLRRRSARWLTLPILLAALIPLASVLGCGSNPQGFTPGTYTYMLTATQYGSPTPLEQGVSTTVIVR